jgi:copper chaperone
LRTTLIVSGMTCGHCVDSVRTALEDVSGVRSARVELDRGRAVVDYDEAETSPRELSVAVAEAGYQSEEGT